MSTTFDSFLDELLGGREAYEAYLRERIAKRDFTFKGHQVDGWVGQVDQLPSGKVINPRLWALCWCRLPANASVHRRGKTRKGKRL